MFHEDGAQKGNGFDPGADNGNCAVPQTFTVSALADTTKDISNMELDQSTFTYDGWAHHASLSKMGLVRNKDFTVAYFNSAGTTVKYPVNAGTYTADITGVGDYTGSARRTITIEKCRIADRSSSSSDDIAYSSYGPYTNISYCIFGIKAKNCKLSYKNLCTGKTFRKAPTIAGRYLVICKAANENYCGTGTAPFTILPRCVDITTLKRTSTHTANLAWTKVYCKGYQVKISTSWNFNYTTVKTINVKSKNIHKLKLTGLKKGKNYYVKVRTYESACGKTFYGMWSLTMHTNAVKTTKFNKAKARKALSAKVEAKIKTIQDNDNGSGGKALLKKYFTKPSKAYDGSRKAITSDVLTYGIDYKIIYTDYNLCTMLTCAPKAIGCYDVSIVGLGDYKGSTLSMWLNISPAIPKIKSVTRLGKGKYKVSWAKVPGGITGYVVQVDTKGTFYQDSSMTQILRASSTSLTLTKLTTGQRYYIHIRARKVNSYMWLCGKYSKTVSFVAR